MTILRSALSLAFFIAIAPCATAVAEEPAAFTFSPAPPGTTVQSGVVYLAGEAMHSQWRAVISKKKLGTSDDGTAFYQWYFSLYAIDGATYRLKYRSPRDGGPLSAVTKANGANLWFPMQSVKIVGTGEFMQPAVQQVVVQSHESAADCGGGTVSVFAYNSKTGKPFPSATVTNGCDLSARIVRANGSAAIRLVGPYYGPNAAMCCPTKPKAAATLRYVNGKWVETPSYYQLKAQ